MKLMRVVLLGMAVVMSLSFLSVAWSQDPAGGTNFRSQDWSRFHRQIGKVYLGPIRFADPSPQPSRSYPVPGLETLTREPFLVKPRLAPSIPWWIPPRPIDPRAFNGR